jgi:Arc/MetJ-type ribon-helix-helix transcriptional regulator
MCYTAFMPIQRNSRVFSISLPPEMADRVDAVAERDSRSRSEVLREAFRMYYAQDVKRILDEFGEYAKTRNPHGYTEADVPRLVKEVRAETRAEKDLQRSRTARRAL